jgi:hypothetical protein
MGRLWLRAGTLALLRISNHASTDQIGFLMNGVRVPIGWRNVFGTGEQ